MCDLVTISCSCRCNFGWDLWLQHHANCVIVCSLDQTIMVMSVSITSDSIHFFVLWFWSYCSHICNYIPVLFF